MEEQTQNYVMVVPLLLLGGSSSIHSVKENLELNWFPQIRHILGTMGL